MRVTRISTKGLVETSKSWENDPSVDQREREREREFQEFVIFISKYNPLSIKRF